MIDNFKDKNILVIDIETTPLIVYTFSLKTDYIGPSQIIKNPELLAVAANWAESDEVMYKDRSKFSEREIAEWTKELLDKADIVVGQNSKRFDTKFINARIEFFKMTRPSDYRQQDTKLIAKASFNLPSYSLKAMCEYFGLEHRKTDHAKFPGLELWKACEANIPEAWEEMKSYNIMDVKTTKELWTRLIKWDDKVTYHSMDEDCMPKCDCGSLDLRKNGYRFRGTAKYQRYSCFECGKPVIGRVNLLSPLKKSEMPR